MSRNLSLRRLGQKGRWRQCQGGEAKAGKGKAGILPGVANGSTDGLPADRVANGWTYGLPAYGGAGWVSQFGMVHDRFAHMKMRRYDYYSACSDGCFFCVWQMIDSDYVTGYELSNVAGYSGLDFVHDARRRGVDTTSLEVYFKAQEVKAKTQTETHLRDNDLRANNWWTCDIVNHDNGWTCDIEPQYNGWTCVLGSVAKWATVQWVHLHTWCCGVGQRIMIVQRVDLRTHCVRMNRWLFQQFVRNGRQCACLYVPLFPIEKCTNWWPEVYHQSVPHSSE